MPSPTSTPTPPPVEHPSPTSRPCTTTTTITSPSHQQLSSSGGGGGGNGSSGSSATTTHQIFSRLGLTNPFASSRLATVDKNSRRKSSTRLLGVTSAGSPAFKMSRMWKGPGKRRDSGGESGAASGGAGQQQVYPCAGGSVGGSEDAVGARGKGDDGRKRSSTMGSLFGMGGGGDVGEGEGNKSGVSMLKRSASSGSLARLIGGRLGLMMTGKGKGNDEGEETMAASARTGSADDAGRAESRASSSAGSGVGLTRSNAVNSRGHSRKSSWRSSWGFPGGTGAAAAAGLSNSVTNTTHGSNRDSANSTNSHISFASTNATDGSVENSTSTGAKGFGRRKTSSTLHGIAGGKSLGLGLGVSGLEMTPVDKKENTTAEKVATEAQPNTHDGVFTTTAAAETTAADGGDSTVTAAAHKNNTGVGSAAESLTRRIKIPRLKPNNFPPSDNDDTTATGTAPTGRARSKSEGADTFLATPAKIMRHKPFLTTTSGSRARVGGGSSSSSNNNNNNKNKNKASTAAENASTTALRGSSTSSESGVSLPSGAARNHGLAGGIAHLAGLTSLSSPNLLLLDDGRDSVGNGSGGRKQQGGMVDAGSKTTAAWFSAGKARDPPPMLPALLPSEEYLLGEMFAPEIDSVIEGGGNGERKVSCGSEIVLGEWGVGRVEEEGQKTADKKAVERVLENRRRAVACEREERGGGGSGDDRTVKGNVSLTGRRGGEGVELAKEAGAGPDEQDEASDVEAVTVGTAPAERNRSENTTPKPNSGQLEAAQEVTIRGRSTLADPVKRTKHDKVIPSQSSSVYSTANTTPPTPLDSSDPPGTGYSGNEYVKEIETELVDDRWVDFSPMNEVRAL
ncbi:hypothetical protein B0J12DRAFT_703395 [Macrophomina phaseolina]|uniref:Uncharacterized protein n=1 Tax=Macrophomina phaseolina TaxID=35725 RepID=A0ABQ8FYN4_9PEZI|nr:hypothetical protein B0J12DRAFT_703395 [Macrophomina phaseolina]